jgi:hypothetical protein
MMITPLICKLVGADMDDRTVILELPRGLTPRGLVLGQSVEMMDPFPSSSEPPSPCVLGPVFILSRYEKELIESIRSGKKYVEYVPSTPFTTTPAMPSITTGIGGMASLGNSNLPT